MPSGVGLSVRYRSRALVHSAMKHSSFLAVFPAPLRKPPSPSNPLRVPRSRASSSRKVLTPLLGFYPGFYRREASFNITIPNPVKVFRPPSKPLYCVRQCNGRYHSASEHGSYLSVFRRSINAPSIAFPVLQASSAVSTSCLSRQPHKACCCHSPLRSLTGVANANELPQLLLRSAA